MVLDDDDALLACLFPRTGLVHAFTVLSHTVGAARLVVLQTQRYMLNEIKLNQRVGRWKRGCHSGDYVQIKSMYFYSNICMMRHAWFLQMVVALAQGSWGTEISK